MVATSPAVASLALVLGKYSMTTRRGGCFPQPSVCSPPPSMATCDGVREEQPERLRVLGFHQEAHLLAQAIDLLERAARVARGLGAVPPGHGLVGGSGRGALVGLGFGGAQLRAGFGFQLFDLALLLRFLAAALGGLVIQALLFDATRAWR